EWKGLEGLKGSGEIVEVVEEPSVIVGEISEPVSEVAGEVAEPAAEVAGEVAGEVAEPVVEVVAEAVEPVAEQTVIRLPRIRLPSAPPRFIGPSGAVAPFLSAGITILTMTDCNTAHGIFALYRQGSGGMANKYADQQMRQIKK